MPKGVYRINRKTRILMAKNLDNAYSKVEDVFIFFETSGYGEIAKEINDVLIKLEKLINKIS